MNTDIILYIFQACDSYTKIPLSLVSRDLYAKTRFYIQDIETAIDNSDVFSIINKPNWHKIVSCYDLGVIGSEFLILRYQAHTHDSYDKRRIFNGACRGGHIHIVKLISEIDSDWNIGSFLAC